MYSNVENIKKMLANKYLDMKENNNSYDIVELIGANFLTTESTIFGEQNFDYIEREIDWYMSQSININNMKGKIPNIWKQVANDKGFINSNYGYLLFNRANNNQYDNVIKELINNKGSRRAIAIYTRPIIHYDAINNGMNDFICTNTVQYLIRDDKLITIVNMRSNDAVYGYKNDFAWQIYVANKIIKDLKSTYNNLKMGYMVWQVGSLHVYKRHYNLIENFIESYKNAS